MRSAFYTVIGILMILWAAAGMVAATVFLVHVAMGGSWHLLAFSIACLFFSVLATYVAKTCMSYEL